MSKKTKSKKGRMTDLWVAIEIAFSELHLLVFDSTKEGGAIRTDKLTWRTEAGLVHSDEGVRELTLGLKTLVDRNHLSGCNAWLALSSDFCVTRVSAGDNEDVKKELRELEERSALYLSLGTGDNKLADNARALDARSQQAWLTVINQKNLDAILTACADAGIRVELVEHSLLSLSRLIGRLKHDAEEPVLILEINERGVDVGISYNGELLLDYRPGGVTSSEEVAEVVTRHLERLQRYCRRRFRHATGDIRRIFVRGEEEVIQAMKATFQDGGKFIATGLEPDSLYPEASFSHEFSTVTGMTLLHELPPERRCSPNLVADLNAKLKEPLGPALIKIGWPLVAAALVTIGIFGAVFHQQRECSKVTQKLDALASAKSRVQHLQVELNQARSRFENLKLIKGQLRPIHWHALIAEVGTKLPSGTWLERINVDSNGLIQMIGPSNSEDGIYEFVKNLKSIANLEDVALEGTQPSSVDGEPITKYEISSKLAQSEQPAPEKDE
jgi:hypothetical protein